MVRHGESPYSEGTERTRGLTPKGMLDAQKVTEILKDEGIKAIISSPYTRAVLTLEGLAKHLNIEIKTYEELRERHFGDDHALMRDDHFMKAFEQSFLDFDFTLPGGESNKACQERSVAVFKKILHENQGEKIAIGTHGNVMTLMMNHFCPDYGWEFLNQTTKPDIYKMQFDHELGLKEVTRLWPI